MASELRAIYFDAGNTLLFPDRHRLLAVVRRLGISADASRFEEIEYRARQRLAELAQRSGRGTESHVWNEYFGTIFREWGVPEAKLAAVTERVRQMHEELDLWSLVPEGTHEALVTLRRRGFRLGVISNADGRVASLLKRAGLLAHLDIVVDSGIEGVEKPDPRIFAIALARTGVAPHQAIHVGDLYHVDVLGARGAGMRAVLVDPLGQLTYPCERIKGVTELPEYLAGV